MILLLSILFSLNDSIPDTTARERVDTLRQVIVRGEAKSPLEKAIESSLARQGQSSTPSLGALLEKLSPGINDKMLHPFAIKQRKRERKHKRDRKILEEYDQIVTFKDLLDAAVQRQQLEDEAERQRAEVNGQNEAHEISK
ncbi:MAG: hypothetical protein J5661_07030 [Bacteroidaceae bacterium]|nr:hypothetical protein [Bacteroidaceae bacterium]